MTTRCRWMRTRVLVGAAASALLTSACGAAPEPGPRDRRGALLFWLVESTELSTTGCGDDPRLAPALEGGVAIQKGNHVILQYTEEGDIAHWLECTQRDPDACVRDPADPELTVTGTDLHYERQLTRDIDGGNGCRLHITESWLLQDQGDRMEMTIRRSHALVDAPAACLELERDYEAHSTNGLGLEGCAVTLHVGTRLD